MLSRVLELHVFEYVYEIKLNHVHLIATDSTEINYIDYIVIALH